MAVLSNNFDAMLSDALKLLTMGELHKNDCIKVFDWDTAAKVLFSSGAVDASAGLAEDWSATSGVILKNRCVYMDRYVYLGSTWATPGMIYTDSTGDIHGVPCWRYADQVGWDHNTNWPMSARAIYLNLK